MAYTHVETVHNSGNSAAPDAALSAAPGEDNLIVTYCNINGSQTITPDAGGGASWTLGADVLDPGSQSCRHAMWWKNGNSSEPSTPSITLSGSVEWAMLVWVFSASASSVVDAAANSHIQSGTSNDLVAGAADGESIAANAVSIIGAGKDTRRSGSQAYTTADNSYTNVQGNVQQMKTAGASRIYTGATTFSGDITIETADSNDDGPADHTYSIHMSFVESGGGGGIVVPVAWLHYRQIKAA